MNDELRSKLTALLKSSEYIPYDERLGDTSNPDYVGPLGIAALVEEIIAVIEENVTDVTHPNDYSEICAYCRRASEGKYG